MGCFGWVGPVAVVLVSLVSVALVLPSVARARREANFNTAVGALKALAQAQSSFKGIDADRNGVADFWTADVVGLSIIRPLRMDGDLAEHGIGLIDPSLAAADGDADSGAPEYSTRLGIGSRPFPTFQPWAGYLFRSARGDGIANPPLREDTDSTELYLKAHSMERFAFLAHPVSLGQGEVLLILNQDNTLYRSALSHEFSCRYEGSPMGSRATVLNSGMRHLDVGEYPVNPCAVGYSK